MIINFKCKEIIDKYVLSLISFILFYKGEEMFKYFLDAKVSVDEMYKSLTKVADDIVSKHTKDIDKIVKEIENNVEKLDNKEIRMYTLKLSSLAYSLGDLVEHADLKRDCANALVKETSAKEFNLAAGTVDTKKNVALLNSSQEQAVSMLYNTVADLFKTKLNSVYRVVDSLKNVLISRNAEAILQNMSNMPTVEEEQF